MTKRGKSDSPIELPMKFDEVLDRLAQARSPELEDAAVIGRFERQIGALLSAFEEARHETETGVEIWYARDLMNLFGYPRWQKFRELLARARASLKGAGLDPDAHFRRADGGSPWNPDEVFTLEGKNPRGGRTSEDVIVTRRAAYLIAQNADPSKPPVAFAQRYFAEQTRRQEIADQSVEALTEDQRRVLIRDEVAEQNKGLASAARSSGVATPKDFAIFQTEGYRGLYGGLNVDGIKRAKGIGAREQILDRMGSTELAANLFRLTQTEERLRRGDIKSKVGANLIHHEIGRKVRSIMIENSGVPPEKIAPADDIKHARKRVEAVNTPALQLSAKKKV
jgi:DNA-damage-inducible protein D